MVRLTGVRVFCGATMVQIFKILTWRDFGPLRQWSRKFPSRIFYPFCAPQGQKLRIGLFGRRASNGAFDWRATKTWIRSFLCSPRLKITDRSFWPACKQMVLLTGLRPKPGFDPFEVRPWVKFSKFLPGEIWTFTPMVPKFFLQDFLPILGAPRPKIMNRYFVIVVRPNGAFD